MGDRGVLWPFCGEIDIMEHYGDESRTSHGSFYSTDESITNPTHLERRSSEILEIMNYKYTLIVQKMYMSKIVI